MSDVAYDPIGSRNAGADWAARLGSTFANARAGNQLAAGNYGGAAGTLFQSGNIDGGRQLLADQAMQAATARTNQTATRAQEDADKARTLGVYKTTTRAVRSALSTNGLQGALSAFDSLVPSLKLAGATDEQLAPYRQAIAENPEGALNAIEATIGQEELNFQKTGDTLRVFQGNNPDPIRSFDAPPEDYTLGNTRFRGATNAPVAQGYIAPEIIQQDPFKNVIEISPGVQPGAVGGGGSGQPRGIRNNNPGNIEDGAFAKSLPGYVGSDGRFAIFDSPESGAQAAPRLLQSYIQRGFDTPAEIINRWAPPSDNNPTDAYIRYVAQRAGIGPNDTVTPDKVPLIAAAIREFENGERGPSQGSSGGGPRVLAAAQSPAAGGGILSPEEVTAAGLAPGTVAQRSTTGQISILQAAPGQGRQGNPTEAQNKDSFNANRMSRAGAIIRDLERNDYDFGRAQLGAQLTENFRKYDAAAQEWTDSILRMTTGAAATKDEVESNRRSYFPLPGDSPAVREQKARQRDAVERDALARGQGGRSSAPQGQQSQAQPQGQQQRRQPERPPAPPGRQYVPGIRFAITEAQARERSRLLQNGATPNAPLGSALNPRYANPDIPASQSINNLPRGQYILDDNGVLRGPKP